MPQGLAASGVAGWGVGGGRSGTRTWPSSALHQAVSWMAMVYRLEWHSSSQEGRPPEPHAGLCSLVPFLHVLCVLRYWSESPWRECLGGERC